MENFGQDEHPLNSLLDYESEEDFGQPEVRDKLEHHANPEANGNLKSWTAEDFSSIYVRFRPHLERHARRYLTNSAQAEEVVQDAFLYLMTSLPELDSELGVLKFLKWKVRLLSFDVLKSASRRNEKGVSDHLDFSNGDDEITADLERAEDNAVIQLALAKLSPRHREALLASVYEEKSSEALAEQLGMTPNAVRQLLFRARSAFRKALVGESEIRGKSASEVLSMAAKRVALGGVKHSVKVGGVILIAALSLGIIQSFTLSGVGSSVTNDALYREQSSDQPRTSLQKEAIESGESEVRKQPVATEIEKDKPADLSKDLIMGEMDIAPQDLTSETTQIEELSSLREADLGEIRSTNASQAGFYQGSYASIFGNLFQGESIEVFAGTGISAFLDYNTQSQRVDQIIFQMRIDGDNFYAAAKSMEFETVYNVEGKSLAILSEQFYVLDDQQNVYADSPLAEARAVVTLDLDSKGNPAGASLMFQ